MKSSWIAIIVGIAVLSQASAGCSRSEQQLQRQEVLIGQCTKICDASGVWLFEDTSERWIGDIWMEPEGIYVRNRETESVRFYESVEIDQYQNEDGELLEFESDDLMIRHLVTGRRITQRRAS